MTKLAIAMAAAWMALSTPAAAEEKVWTGSDAFQVCAPGSASYGSCTAYLMGVIDGRFMENSSCDIGTNGYASAELVLPIIANDPNLLAIDLNSALMFAVARIQDCDESRP